jgi:hypothetical protein
MAEGEGRPETNGASGIQAAEKDKIESLKRVDTPHLVKPPLAAKAFDVDIKARIGAIRENLLGLTQKDAPKIPPIQRPEQQSALPPLFSRRSEEQNIQATQEGSLLRKQPELPAAPIQEINRNVQATIEAGNKNSALVEELTGYGISVLGSKEQAMQAASAMIDPDERKRAIRTINFYYTDSIENSSSYGKKQLEGLPSNLKWEPEEK